MRILTLHLAAEASMRWELERNSFPGTSFPRHSVVPAPQRLHTHRVLDFSGEVLA